MMALTTQRSNALAVYFKELERWDVKFFSQRLRSIFPVVPLASYICEHNEKVKPYEHPEKTFRILGVTNNGGIFHAYDEFGKKINQPYKKVDPGDFAYNPYRINVGSIGIVPDNLGGNYISPAYVVFKVDHSRIKPLLLLIILKSAWYNPFLRSATAGSVRQNLTFELLGTLKIPLPPLTVQQAILAKWQKAQEEICKSRKRIERLKVEMDAQFLGDLGLTPSQETHHEKHFAVWWKDFLRWSVSYNQAARIGVDITRGKYPIVSLGTILQDVQYGTSEKANTKDEGTPVLRMNNIIKGLLDLSDLKYICLPEKEWKALLLKDGDILFNRTNSKELVGKCAVFHESGNYVFASYLIRVRPDFNKANPDFLAYAINSPLGRFQIDALSRQIIGQANINTGELRSLQFPLPPLPVQEAIMRRVEEGRAAITREQKRTRRIATAIEQEVEEMILGVRPVSDVYK